MLSYTLRPINIGLEQIARTMADIELLTILSDFYDEADARIAEAEEKYPILLCPTDCGECCHTQSHFPVTALEYLYLCKFVREHAGETARRRWRAQAEALAEAKAGCPFAEAGRCSVHSARPSTCRFYGRTNRADGAHNLCPRVRAELKRQRLPAEMLLPITDMLTALLGRRLQAVAGAMGPEKIERLLSLRPIAEYVRLAGFADQAVLRLCGIYDVH